MLGLVPFDGAPSSTGDWSADSTVSRWLAGSPSSQQAASFAMAVEEVVGLGRLPHEHPIRGMRPADCSATAAAIDRVGVGHLLGRHTRGRSLGERQLVLLAMAVAQEAPLLVLDEPTAHLDIRHQVAVMELLTDLNERDGVTIVGVLHDLALARHFFPRPLLLDRGELVADGPADDSPGRRIRDVFVDPALVGLGVGRAAATDDQVLIAGGSPTCGRPSGPHPGAVAVPRTSTGAAFSPAPAGIAGAIPLPVPRRGTLRRGDPP
jgi:iron complex transport system ATP-binding protein